MDEVGPPPEMAAPC